jgi:hypothetical protein
MLADCYDALENIEYKVLSSVTANVIVRWEDSGDDVGALRTGKEEEREPIVAPAGNSEGQIG